MAAKETGQNHGLGRIVRRVIRCHRRGHHVVPEQSAINSPKKRPAIFTGRFNFDLFHERRLKPPRSVLLRIPASIHPAHGSGWRQIRLPRRDCSWDCKYS